MRFSKEGFYNKITNLFGFNYHLMLLFHQDFVCQIVEYCEYELDVFLHKRKVIYVINLKRPNECATQSTLHTLQYPHFFMFYILFFSRNDDAKTKTRFARFEKISRV